MEDRAEHFFDEGVAFAKLGHFEEAIVSYDKAIAINPNDARFMQDNPTEIPSISKSHIDSKINPLIDKYINLEM